jgi:pimeloyl-ACP methyl ester carboxylesterase
MSSAASIAYREHRGGDPQKGHPPLIFIHGAGGNYLHWPAEIRRMEREHVFALDLPGHGDSGKEGERTIKGYVKHLVSWMDALELGSAVLIGHSMGGAIALTTALEMPERVSGLILVGTGGRLRVSPMILELSDNAEMLNQAVEVIITWAFSDKTPANLISLAQKRMAETHPDVLHGDFSACDEFDVMERLGELAMPVQIICGNEDQLTPVKYSRFLSESIPDARLDLVEDAGHMVMLEKPGEVLEIIQRFLEVTYT